jgi:sulfite exporter TauE/SafE
MLSLITDQGTISTASILGFGFALGLKHAIEADHLAAVSTIVSERKSVWSSSLVGGLWGLGHTISLLLVGVLVIVLHLRISDRVAEALEFCVALMLVALGLNALFKLYRGQKIHIHEHEHGGHRHLHVHSHDGRPEPGPDTHHGFKLQARPLLVGMVHGMAGSAALMLMVLAAISSTWVGLLYIGVFGVGSIGGMMLMSALVGLPLSLTVKRFTRANLWIRGMAAVFSLILGILLAYQIGIQGGLLAGLG